MTAQQGNAFASEVLVAVGLPEEDAEVIADALIWADLRGIPAQGIAKLPTIIARLESGGNRTRPNIRRLADTTATTLTDADDEWGHISAVRGMRGAMAKAAAVGVGLSVVRNTSSGSAMGYYVSLAADQGMIGIAINNSAPLLRTWGGTTEVVGNQAFAIGAPAHRHPSLIFDTALSAISRTRLQELLAAGALLPEGVALDHDNLPTTDPQQALDGSLLPVGGHRGFGLAIMFEVLTGVLSGSRRFGSDVSDISDVSQPQGVSQFFLAIDPGMFGQRDDFVDRVDRLIDMIHASPPAGTDPVRVPGEMSHLRSAENKGNINVSEEAGLQLMQLSERLGVYAG